MPLGQKVASLFAEIGADTSKLEKGLATARQELSKTKKGLSEVERSFLQGGKSFGSIRGEVDAFSKTLKSATPENLRFARRFDTIQKAVDRGKISIGDAQTAIGKLKSEMSRAAPLTSKIAGGIQSIAVPAGIAAGAVAAVGVALKTAFDVGRQGALITQTKESFAGLLTVVGAAPDLLDRLKEASKGTVDELSLMSSTATLLAGTQGELATSLANSTPQLLEIAKAANKLNPSLGDTTFLYESLATGIKRASPLILDNLGITLSVGDAYEEFAVSIGKTAQELTKDEQAQALLNATLAKGKILIEQAGGSAASGADSYAQLAAGIKDATNELKELVSKGVEPAVRATVKYLQVTSDSNDMVERAKFLFDEGTLSSRSYAIVLKDLITTKDGITVATQILERAEEKYQRKMKEIDEATASYDRVLKITNVSQNALRDALEDTEMAAKDAADALRDRLGGAMDHLNMLIGGRLGDTVDDFNKSQDELSIKIGEVGKEISDLEKKKMLTPEQFEQLQNLKSEYDDLKTKYQENADEHDEATKRIMFNLLQQQAAADGLSQAEVTALTNIATNWGLVDQATANYVTAAQGYFADLEAGLVGPGDAIAEINRRLDYLNGKTFTTGLVVNIKQTGDLRAPGGGYIDPGTGSTFGGSNPQETQAGGPVFANQPYIVGERGPELFVPSQNGNVVNNRDMKSLGGGRPINVYVSGSVTRDNAYLLARQVGAELDRQSRYN